MVITRPPSSENNTSASSVSLPYTPRSGLVESNGLGWPGKDEGGNQATLIAPLGTIEGIYSRPTSPYRYPSPLEVHSHVDDICSPPTPWEDLSGRESRRISPSDPPAKSVYTGNISVAIRIKPSESSTKDPWYASSNKLIHTEYGEFQFDHVYTKEVTNNEVYRDIGEPIVDKLIQGYNAIIFAYGMTGSGKTFTMSGSKQEPGLIPLCVADIFERITATATSEKSYAVKVSYLEIYNEKIFDLLDSNDTAARQAGKNTAGLKVRDDSTYGVKVVDLIEQKVASHSEVMKCIATGDRNRKTGETDCNTRSSRSHAIVLLRLDVTNSKTGLKTTSTLSLCDLAGSERAVSQLVRRQEGSFINKSLLALGTVISKLSSNGNGSGSNGHQLSSLGGHIPYRDSKLTRILQPALTGDSIITTICTIDTKLESSAETTNTVRFASRAKNIFLNVRKNEFEMNTEKDHIIQNLRKQLDEQHATIAMLRRNNYKENSSVLLPTGGGGSLSEKALKMEKGLLEVENNILKTKLEHCEKLLEKDTVVLEDPHVREIVDVLPSDIASLLESKVQSMESQLRQYRQYVLKLETDLEKAQKNIIETNTVQFDRQSTANIQQKYGEDVDVELLLEEQEAELMELRRALERKDKMIEALQSARRLRNSALSQVTTVVLNKKSLTIEDMKDM
ncbi:HEL147Wp [Eremothecium sinecaudum]|uniref:Kinesin-like protein n=1 Tax=Eremothecium sinecaudum TaxID=45286 RepID=A0A0X8HTD6_9SACH|nr:HEL147Wp [Eremothecium sinecaudum]AMD21134.1 HEL147Wp [Eremothecium sinecaudum]